MALTPLRCPHCLAAERYAPRFGDVRPEDFDTRYELVAGLTAPPWIMRIKCSYCNGYSTIRERTPLPVATVEG